MGRVNTNQIGLRHAIENGVGIYPTVASTGAWTIAEPNTINAYGATITTVVRRPISTTRGRRKGTVVDLDSSVEYEGDLTVDSFLAHVEGFMFSEFANVEFDLTHPKVNQAALPTTATGYDFTVGATLASATNATELAAKAVFAASGARSLFYAKGYTNAANNGLKVLSADLTSASTEVVVSGGLTVETPPTNARLHLVGVRVDDLTLTISGTTATLVSAADVANWATLGLRKGMWIHLGSANASTGQPQNAFGVSNAVYGYARVSATPTDGTLNLDKLDVKLTGGPYTPGADVDVLFGQFARNVAVSAAANDERYLIRSYLFEASYPGLGSGGATAYEYAEGNHANVMTLDLPLTEKATIVWGFVGTDSDPITETRTATAPAPVNALGPTRTTAFGTSSQIISLTTDLVTLASDVCFKQLSIEINNSMTPEKCLGHLGAQAVNAGLFTVDLDGQMWFSDATIISKIRDNATVTFATVLANEDGSIVLDVPSATATGGDREFPEDATVLANVTLQTFTDPSYGYDLGVNVILGTPWVRP